MGGIYRAVIGRRAVVFGRTADLGAQGVITTTALDVSTGELLWERKGEAPLLGAPLLLAAGPSVERVDERTGRTIWRSTPVCGGSGDPDYAASVGGRLYVGCAGGQLAALGISNGRLAASAKPMTLDEYDQIVPLGDGKLWVSGMASGAFMYKQSAIVRGDTLSSVVVFQPDHRILGVRDGDVLVDDTCCGGTKSDSWPGVIQRVSLASGTTISTVNLHPYPYTIPTDSDLPGPGMVLAVGNDLYVGTHSALFVYNLTNLDARPRVLYGDLSGSLPVAIDNRYLLLELGPNGSQQTVLLDSYANARVIWTEAGRWGLRDQRGAVLQIFNYTTGVSSLLLANAMPRAFPVDPTCAIQASSGSFVFVECRNLGLNSHEHIGGMPKCVTVGQSSTCPESIAVYALPVRTQ